MQLDMVMPMSNFKSKRVSCFGEWLDQSKIGKNSPMLSLIKQQEMFQSLLPCIFLRQLRFEFVQTPRNLTKLNSAILVFVKQVEESVYS